MQRETPWHDEAVVIRVQIVVRLIEDALRWLMLLARSDESVRAENLVLRRQLAMFIERGVQPRRVDAAQPFKVSIPPQQTRFLRRTEAMAPNAISGTRSRDAQPLGAL
jgi:hypothetical protein